MSRPRQIPITPSARIEPRSTEVLNGIFGSRALLLSLGADLLGLAILPEVGGH